MYKKNDYVVYKKDVCIVKEIRNNKMNGKDYYILTPIDDKSLIIDVPIDNKLGYLRDVISKEEADNLIKNIPNINPLVNLNDKYIEKTYKDLLTCGTYEDLIKIIKTTYLRNNDRMMKHKKVSEKDSYYFTQAEKYLYNELSIALQMDFESTKNYIIKKVEELSY